MKLSEFFTQEKVQELIDTIVSEGARRKGIKKFSQKYGLTFGGVRDYFYKKILTPKLDKKLPKGKTIPTSKLEKFFTQELIQELIQEIKLAGERNKGIKQFSDRYGLNPSSVNVYFYKNIFTPELDKQLPRGRKNWQNVEREKISCKQALHEILSKKGDTLTKEDIEQAARKAGVHYHTALSTWAAMVANGEAIVIKADCNDTNCPWRRGQAFASLIDSGVSVKEIVRAADISPAEVKVLARTYKAFPNSKDREPSLSFSHHRLACCKEAVKKATPQEWIKRAAAEGWSTREMAAAIKGEPVVSISKLKEENTALKDQVKTLQEKLAAMMIRENKETKGWHDIDDIDNMVEEVSKVTHLSKERVERVLGDVMTSDEYIVYRDYIQHLRSKNRELEQQLAHLQSEKSRCCITVGHITELYEKISELEEKLSAARRVSLSTLKMLQARNSLLKNTYSKTQIC